MRSDTIVGLAAILLCLPLCYAWGLLLIALSGGSWVGAGHVPLPLLVKVGTFVPGAAYLTCGIVLGVRGFRTNSPAGCIGVVCALAGLVLLWVMWIFIELWHVT